MTACLSTRRFTIPFLCGLFLAGVRKAIKGGHWTLTRRFRPTGYEE
jgi:hypothetical protein